MRNVEGNHAWRLVWDWMGPERIKTFLWLVMHERLLTNLECLKRGMTTDGTCSICNVDEETTLHVLHDCIEARMIWVQLIEYRQ